MRTHELLSLLGRKRFIVERTNKNKCFKNELEFFSPVYSVLELDWKRRIFLSPAVQFSTAAANDERYGEDRWPGSEIKN